MTASALRCAALVGALTALAAVPVAAAAPPPNVISVVRNSPGPSAVMTLGESGATRFVRPDERNRGTMEAVWSPDGGRIALVAWIIGPNREPFTDIVVAPAGRGPGLRVTTGRNAFSPAWSPDGTTIAYARATPLRWDASARAFTGGGSAIWLVNADGTGHRLLHAAAPLVYERPGAWSPDGRSVAVSSCPYVTPGARGFQPNRCSVVVIDVATGTSRTVAEAAAEPDYSPDGTRIVFTSVRDRLGRVRTGSDETGYANEVYVMNADGTAQTRITATPALSEEGPRFSPDGARIVVNRRSDGFGRSVRQMNADGTCSRRVIAASAGMRPVSWEAPRWLPLTGRRTALGPIAC